MESLSIWHWLIVLLVAALLFGNTKLRDIASSLSGGARSLGEGDGLGTSWALALPRGDQDTYSRAERLRDDLVERFRSFAIPGMSLTHYESLQAGCAWSCRSPTPTCPS